MINKKQCHRPKPVTSRAMLEAQALWRNIYKGSADWNNQFTPSLFLAAGLCSETARAVTLELNCLVKSGQEQDSGRTKWLAETLKPVIDGFRQTVEKCCAGGTIVFHPFVRDDVVQVDVLETNCFCPVCYDKLGALTGAVFSESVRKDGDFYTRLEKGLFENGDYIVENRAFISDNPVSLGREVPLDILPEWAGIEPVLTFHNTTGPWFTVFKMPQLNHVEQGAPEGVSLFSKAINLLREADKQFARTIWEFEGGELAINADADMFRKEPSGRLILPRGKERLFRTYENNSTNDSFGLQTFNPAFRDQSLIRGLERIKREIEFVCGVAYGTISDPQTVERTATEIRTANQRFYATVNDIQRSARLALESLTAVLNDVADFYGLAPFGEYKLSIDWGDSILADRPSELDEKLRLLKAGVITQDEVRNWYFNI